MFAVRGPRCTLRSPFVTPRELARPLKQFFDELLATLRQNCGDAASGTYSSGRQPVPGQLDGTGIDFCECDLRGLPQRL